MPQLKRANDPRRSALVLLYENHYGSIAEDLCWDVDRLDRLCAAMQHTRYEIGAMIRMKISEMARCVRKNQFPATVEIHLTLIERSIFPNSKPPVFPSCS